MKRLVAIVFVVEIAFLGIVLAQGTIDPPGGAFDTNGLPTATMKTLNQVEPRQIIPSLPFTITNSGSYYVANNLVGTTGQHGIIIDADNVQLDLNGFALLGITNSGPAVNPTFTGIEIDDDPIHKSITIRNGVVAKWGKYGIRSTLAIDCRVSGMTIVKNGSTNDFDGMSLGVGWIISDCRVQSNGGDGISSVGGSTVRKTLVKGNYGNGLNLLGDSLIVDCLVNGNIADGMYVDNNSIVRDCLVINNGTNGIVAGDGCLIKNNNCRYNGSGKGISAKYNCRIEGNHVANNRTGIEVLAPATKTLVIKNTAVYNGGSVNSNYNISVGNHFGQELRNEDLGLGFTNSNPWANFSL